MKTRLFLEGHDVWFFRTSRPFGATQAASSGGAPPLSPPAGVAPGAAPPPRGNRHGVTWSEYHEAWRKGTPPSEGVFRRLGPPTTKTAWPDDAVRLHGSLPARVQH